MNRLSTRRRFFILQRGGIGQRFEPFNQNGFASDLAQPLGAILNPGKRLVDLSQCGAQQVDLGLVLLHTDDLLYRNALITMFICVFGHLTKSRAQGSNLLLKVGALLF